MRFSFYAFTQPERKAQTLIHPITREELFSLDFLKSCRLRGLCIESLFLHLLNCQEDKEVFVLSFSLFSRHVGKVLKNPKNHLYLPHASILNIFHSPSYPPLDRLLTSLFPLCELDNYKKDHQNVYIYCFYFLNIIIIVFISLSLHSFKMITSECTHTANCQKYTNECRLVLYSGQMSKKQWHWGRERK